MFNYYLFYKKPNAFRYVNTDNVNKYIYTIWDDVGSLTYQSIETEFNRFDLFKPRSKSGIHFLLQDIKETGKNSKINFYLNNKDIYNCDKKDIRFPFNNIFDENKLKTSFLYLDMEMNNNQFNLFKSYYSCAENEFYLQNIHRSLLSKNLSILDNLIKKFEFNLIWIYNGLVFIIHNDVNKPMYLHPRILNVSNCQYKDCPDRIILHTPFYIDIKKRFIRNV